MKQLVRNDANIVELINKMQNLLVAIDKKVDALMHRSASEIKPAPKLPANASVLQNKSNDHKKVRMMYTAVCADCSKECQIPFKPNGDRPVYCQDCFSRRKMISLSRIGLEPKPNDIPVSPLPVANAIKTPKPTLKAKKKILAVKKAVTKKKTTPKKK